MVGSPVTIFQSPQLLYGADGYHRRSSLTRDDTGGGSCEVLWITDVNGKKP